MKENSLKGDPKMKIAYGRVSTDKQSLSRQQMIFDQQIGEGNYTLFTDKGFSGSLEFRARPAGKRVWEQIQTNEVSDVYFCSIDRCGRKVSDIVSLLHTMADMGVNVHIIDQGISLLDTEGNLNATASLVLNVLSSVAQIELNLVRQRTRSGIEKAKAEGKFLGRKPGSCESLEKFYAKVSVRKILPLLAEDYPIKYIAKIVGCSPALVRKVKRLEDAKS